MTDTETGTGTPAAAPRPTAAGTGAATAAGERRGGRGTGGTEVVDPGRGAPLPGAVPLDEGRRSPTLVALLLAVLAVPLVVAVAVLHSPRWYPLLDLAQTELRVRDVGGRHTPLVGLAGRIQAYGEQGSHPGPLSFLALWPFYKLFGTTAFALQAASVALHVVAMAGILGVAHRRGGLRLALGFGAALAVLLHAYGTGVFVEPWNPYMPVLWWLLFLLAIWSVLCGDLAMLPLAVFAGSFCMQTHVSYLGLIGGVAGLTVAAAAVWAFVHRRDTAARRPLLRWGGGSLLLGLLLWTPPLLDQLTNDPGNASMIVESFRNPSEESVGLGVGAELVGVHLNLWRLLTGDIATSGSLLPAAALLVVWLGAVAMAWRLRHAALLRLHALVAVVLVLGVVSASRIFGEVWYYLALWAWGIAILVVVATVWTLCAALAARGTGPGPLSDPRRAARIGSWALVAVVAVWTGLFTLDARDAEEPAAGQSDQLRVLAPDTVGALAADEAGVGGREARYLVTWTDPVAIGATGFGLLLELDRQGFDVGVPEFHGTGAVEHRVMAPGAEDAEVHLSVGDDIAIWRDDPAAIEVAKVDLRSDADRRRYAELHDDVVDDLLAAGLGDLVPAVDGALMAIAIEDRAPADVRDRVTEMAEIGEPAAVFVIPRR
ncbi:MAG TPA: hypothetical protein VK306_11070 [Acidimicrobiales bacterium]|nr:hypothetical protein [Acidimicrobiales bacterium]